MNRRELLKLAGLTTAGAALSGPLLAEQQTEAPAVRPRRRGKPNILLIVTDQERSFQDLPDELPLPGHEQLVAQGVTLANYHANTTPCSPSRSVMYTGQHTQKTLIVANHGLPPFNDLSTDLPTLGHMLREQGYTTAYKGKWHLSHVPGDSNLTYGVVETNEKVLEPYGFGDYNLGGDPHGSHLTGYLYDRLTASDAARWLHEHRDDEAPWMLAVNFVNPHDVMFYSANAEQERSRLRSNFLGPMSPGPMGGVYDRFWDLPLPRSFHADDLSDKPWVQHADVQLCNAFYGRLAPEDEAAWKGLQSYYFNCIRRIGISNGLWPASGLWKARLMHGWPADTGLDGLELTAATSSCRDSAWPLTDRSGLAGPWYQG